jgi:hypothetical protein
MRSTKTLLVLLVTALSVAAFALQTETADAAAKRGRTTSAQRDTMIEQCIAKAQAETPFYNPTQPGYRRVDIYKNCMVQAGMRP